MTKRLLLAAAVVALAAPLAPAAADPPPWAPAHGYRAKQGVYGSNFAPYHPDLYYRPGRHYRDHVLTYRDRIYRGRDGRYYCRRSDGTTGLIIGGAVGALIGRELDRGRSRAVGTLVGAGTGALLGREIDRGRLRCD